MSIKKQSIPTALGPVIKSKIAKKDNIKEIVKTIQNTTFIFKPL